MIRLLIFKAFGMSALVDAINGINSFISAIYEPKTDIIEITYKNSTYFADFKFGSEKAIIDGISSGRHIVIHDRHPDDEYDNNSLLFSDNLYVIATMRNFGDFKTISRCNNEICLGK
jgi:hypothetical protein